MSKYIENPKTKGSGIICAIPQKGSCPINCADCFFQSGRSYLEPLDKSLPNLPSKKEAKGRVVRMNDGNDSNNQRDIVMSAAEKYTDYFYNTSIPTDLEGFKAPVVLTVNPHKMTDKSFYRVTPVPKNLMFVRARVNVWNLSLVDEIIEYYAKGNKIPVVLTFMAYYTETIPEEFKDYYIWQKRILNSYYVLKPEHVKNILARYSNLPVYTCGKSCKECGHCLREYYATKEKARDALS